ncbi:MAG: SgcJ/EcaC family oxidoreductase [Rhodothermales bacterium]|nr:SgcJ/EcaC family oxidoreductase [Rhodothermales bacterium]
MNYPSAIPVALVAALVLSGCIDYPVPVDLGAETEVLTDLGARWAAAESNKDLEAALGLYWDDAVMLVPDQNPIEGIEALRAAFQQFFALPFTSLVSGPVAISIVESGDMAYSWANYYITFPSEEGSMTVPNKFIAVWTKRDGEWKIIANMSNSNPTE